MESVQSLLMIEDDIDLAQLTQQYLQQQGMRISVYHDPVDALLAMQSQSFDLVLLDIMLPGIDGFEVCQRIRAFSSLPILMLTARDAVEDKINGLELGADDYLVKPYDPRELMARIKALLKRSGGAVSLESSQPQLMLEAARLLVHFGDQQVELTSMEADTLQLLMQHPDEVLSRDDILNHLRGVEVDVFSRSIDILISRLRAKLKQISPSEWIFTVRGKGYRFAKQTP